MSSHDPVVGLLDATIHHLPLRPRSVEASDHNELDPRVKLAWERTHLATQRTILAWTRTAIAFSAFGVALAKFGLFISLFTAREQLSTHALPPGVPNPALTDALGALLVLVGVFHALIGLAQSTTMKKGPEAFVGYRVWSVRASATVTFVAGLALFLYLILN